MEIFQRPRRAHGGLRQRGEAPQGPAGERAAPEGPAERRRGQHEQPQPSLAGALGEGEEGGEQRGGKERVRRRREAAAPRPQAERLEEVVERGEQRAQREGCRRLGGLLRYRQQHLLSQRAAPRSRPGPAGRPHIAAR